MLSDDDVVTFGLVAAGQLGPGERSDSVARLAEFGYVALNPSGGNRPVALDPEQVSERRMRAALEEAALRVQQMSQIPDLTDRLAAQYERAHQNGIGPGAGCEFLDDAVVVNARLDDVVSSAREEILAAQPGGPRNRVQLNRSVERGATALARGVRIRTLYRADVRETAVTAEYARTMTVKGVEYRTLVAPYERAIIVDRRVAFVSNHLIEGAPAHAAWQITHPGMVAYVVAEFEAKWRMADPWHGELRPRGQEKVDTVSGVDGVRTTRRQREIMRDQCAGIPQQATARRLGISTRTLSNELSELKARFDAETAAQLAYNWAFSVDRLVDDSAPAPADGDEGGLTEEAAA